MSDSSHLAMGEGAEFDAIRRLLAVWGSYAVGIGDDAAILDVPVGERLLVSTDASFENVHFRREWMTAEEIGGRATAAALSDLAAMAATPRGLLVALGLPERWRNETDDLARGIGVIASRYVCPILGGNISAAAELSLTITVLGSTALPLTRHGIRVGDGIFVTGTLGGPRAALAAFGRGDAPGAADRRRFVTPQPRVYEAQWLAARGAHAAIDISDGLLADASHLALASGVTIVLSEGRLPRVAGASADNALASGEEYELLVAVPSDTSLDPGAFQRRFGVGLTRVGTAIAKSDRPVVFDSAREAMPSGHDHLATFDQPPDA